MALSPSKVVQVDGYTFNDAALRDYFNWFADAIL
jgi:hypothetical protein